MPPKGVGKPRVLLVKEEDFACGYAPRTMLRGRHALFVGCKDGSITAVPENPRIPTRLHVWDRDAPGHAVRAICEWDHRHLIVGHSDGTVALLAWKQRNSRPIPICEKGRDPEDAVSSVHRINESELLISFRRRGAHLYKAKGGPREEPTFKLIKELPDLQDIRRAIGLQDGRSLMVTSPGELFLWGNSTDRNDWNGWRTGEQPGFLGDVAVLSPQAEPAGRAAGVFLATDNGVFFLDLGPQGLGAPARLALPGLKGFCMALSYVEDERYGFLWAADSRGDCHLFWTEGYRDGSPFEPNFRPSGIVYVGSQVMFALSWRSGGGDGSLVFAQARRNDRIAFAEYQILTRTVAARGKGVKRYRHLLRSGSVVEMRRAIDPKGKLTQDWPDAAVLADFFELLAGNEKNMKVLEEFLSNPSAEVAHGILKTLPPDEIKVAVRLWTFTLLGIMNRSRGHDQSTSYLGIIRWLQELVNWQDFRHGVTLAREVRKAIRFARKWGLFGEANALRQSLSEPIETILKQLEGSQFARQPEALDLLSFEALLFERSTDLLCEETHGRLRGRTAWDLSTLEVGDRTFVAVSWKLGGVDLFELRMEPGATRFVLHAAIVPELKEERYRFPVRRFSPGRYREPDESWQLEYGYSRAVFLGRVKGRHYLLTAPALGSQAEEQEKLVVYELLVVKGGIELGKVRSLALPERESVYRFLEMEEGVVLAGLRGRGGVPRIARIEVVPEERGLRLKARAQFLALQRMSKPMQPSQGTLQNRIWSMALAGRRVFVGLESGEIWYWNADPWPAGEIIVSTAAQMSAPVTALAARSEGKTCRIFAGGADGSIVAWQEVVDPKQKDKDKKDEEKVRRFVSLWATFERGTVAALHPIPADPDFPETRPTVLVVVRSGRCLLLDDRPDIEELKPNVGHPQRPAVPGGRFARLLLPGTVFACMALRTLPGKQREKARDIATGRSALLLTGSEAGEVRLLSLHYLRRDLVGISGEPLRKEKYREILKRWWQIVTVEEGRLDRLRLADAIYQSIQLQPLILVRWLVDRAADPIPGAPDPDDPKTRANLSWQMPRYLRPLLDLRNALDPGRESDGTAGRILEELLRNVWHLEDRRLFQELCIVMLKGSNFAVFSAATEGRPFRGDRVQPLYFEIFEAIERGVQRWVGMPDQQEAAVRMVVAKNMIDGETFLAVLRRAAMESENEKGPFRKIFDKRIEAVRQLVFKRDSLVSLETLRAMNLSLTRLCKCLVDARREGWRPAEGPSEQEAYWPVFEHYFKELINAAQRMLRFRLDLNDAFTHEYCRTFALVVCACPSAAIRIANRLTETQLISDPRSDEDFSWQVFFQFKVLEQIGLAVPPEARLCFKIAVQPPEKILDPVRELLDELKELSRQDFERPTPRAVARLGRPNVDDLYCLCQIYRIVGWVYGLARKLSTDARDIELTKATRDELVQSLQDDATLTTLYSHSQGFWLSALGKLGDRCLLREPSRLRIHPEAVLTSGPLARWARECIEDLDLRYREQRIFQPEYLFFREVLARLERAAEQFPRSAAVQKNIALSVFGHHLLEDLDEHVFELEELAQNLDPLMVWSFREKGRRLSPGDDQPVAYRFAQYLLRRAHHAESIPKNLRTLYGILDSPASAAQTGEQEEESHKLERFLSPYRDWCGGTPAPGVRIKASEFQYLSLSLAELTRNDRQHSGLSEEDRRNGKDPSLTCAPEGTELKGMDVRVWLRPSGTGPESNLERLKRLQDNGLQEPLNPHTDPNVPSTGAGLYLANLAASVVSWEIRLEVGEQEDGFVPCTFHFEKRDTARG